METLQQKIIDLCLDKGNLPKEEFANDITDLLGIINESIDISKFNHSVENTAEALNISEESYKTLIERMQKIDVKKRFSEQTEDLITNFTKFELAIAVVLVNRIIINMSNVSIYKL